MKRSKETKRLEKVLILGVGSALSAASSGRDGRLLMKRFHREIYIAIIYFHKFLKRKRKLENRIIRKRNVNVGRTFTFMSRTNFGSCMSHTFSLRVICDANTSASERRRAVVVSTKKKKSGEKEAGNRKEDKGIETLEGT